MKTKKITIQIQGITNMIMHNGRLADDSDLLTVARKTAQQKYKKNPTKENWEEFAAAMMEGGVYFDDELGVYLPEDNLRAMMVKAAAGIKKKGMQTYKSAVSTIDFDSSGIGFPLTFDGGRHKSLEKFCKTKRYRFEKVVTVQRSKVRSVRPMIPKGWTCDVVIEYRPDTIESETIRTILDNAGLEVGIGDWRPSAPKPGPFGQFMVVKVNGKKV